MTITTTTRTQVAERAESRCEYCRMLEVISSHSFHVDHIIPIKHDGSDALDNLGGHVSVAICTKAPIFHPLIVKLAN